VTLLLLLLLPLRHRHRHRAPIASRFREWVRYWVPQKQRGAGVLFAHMTTTATGAIISIPEALEGTPAHVAFIRAYHNMQEFAERLDFNQPKQLIKHGMC